ncbi:putative oligopeptide ABC transporter, permease protein OppC [Oribacterium sp. oral taxon 078 str. F0262]|uniref:ABC transporter permease n=1 Tax=Oribacterium sp. oral taxon 078 TaxID=652706 RepID=UPI0001BCB8F5|nr:ABC transporter permease [Oribacterium sp. oral taxon 078]EFE92280.1 putative oligopeptide ABC transporter, permease protein OppC [Oribacterium sp. oral taxon 078 str. F0262]
MKRNWEALQQTNEERERIWRKTRSFAGDVWSRFRKKPTAIAGFLIIVLLVLFSVLGPLFTGKSYSEQDLNAANIAPRIKVFETPDGNGWLYITQSMKLLRVSAEGEFGEQLSKLREDSERQMLIFDYEGSELGLYYGKKPYLVVNPDTLVIAKSRRIRNRDYLLGTDSLGRDILTRLMYGSRVSLVVAFVAVIVNLLIGILYGGISGYLGGNVDEFMMRIVDIISTIPLTLYVILIMVLLGSGLGSIIVALGSVYWVGMARVVRGQVLSLKQQEFVLAARTIGSSTSTILFRHLIPNAMGAILVTATMLIPSAIFMEAFLGFLGIGLKPPLASLGTMCNDATENLRSCPYQLFIPAFVIVLIMFAFNFVGDGLRDALDPKLRK